MWRTLTGALLAAFLAVGCADGYEDVRFFDGHVLELRGGEPALGLDLNGCKGEFRLAELEETEDQVRIRVERDRFDGDGDEPACAASLTVRLGAPLGDRSVVDLTTGEIVDVSR